MIDSNYLLFMASWLCWKCPVPKLTKQKEGKVH